MQKGNIDVLCVVVLRIRVLMDRYGACVVYHHGPAQNRDIKH